MHLTTYTLFTLLILPKAISAPSLVIMPLQFTYPTHVIQGNQNLPFGVKTKLGLTLTGEYENLFKNNHLKTFSLPKRDSSFNFQVIEWTNPS